MKNRKLPTLTLFLAVAAALAAPAPAVDRSAASQKSKLARKDRGSCDKLAKMVDAAVPRQIGEPAFVHRLRNPKVEPMPPLAQRFDPAAAASPLGDPLDCDCKPRGETTCNTVEGRLKLDLDRELVSYVNDKRHFDPLKDPASEWSPERGLAVATRIAAELGVPGSQAAPSTAKALAVFAANTPTGVGASQPADERLSKRAEIVTLIPRHVDGFPVLGSLFRAAVDRNGQIARLRLRWQDFHLDPMLAQSRPVQRRKVVDQILDTLRRNNVSCGSVAGLSAFVAYVPSRYLGSAEETEGSDELPAVQSVLLPALVVTEAPLEQKEDSGIVQSAGILHILPLFLPPPVGDRDTTRAADAAAEIDE